MTETVMKTIKEFADLVPYGITLRPDQTYSSLVVCDFTPAAAGNIRPYIASYGLTIKAGSNGRRAYAVLPTSLFTTLAIVSLLKNGCQEAWMCEHYHRTFIGIEPEDTREAILAAEAKFWPFRRFRDSQQRTGLLELVS